MSERLHLTEGEFLAVIDGTKRYLVTLNKDYRVHDVVILSSYEAAFREARVTVERITAWPTAGVAIGYCVLGVRLGGDVIEFKRTTP